MDVHDLIAAERLRLVARLRGLDDAQWRTPSLCAGWTVQHVLAHLVTPFAVSVPQMFARMARTRSIGRAMDVTAHDLATRRPEELLDLLERNASSTFRPPGMPSSAPLTDATVHSADIRWVIGDEQRDWADPERLRPVLEFLVSPRALMGFVPRGRAAGLRLVADDQEWSHGSGPEVRGPSLALAMGLLGRTAALPQLTGAGAPALV